MPENRPPAPNPDTDQKIFDKVFVESTNAQIGINPEGGYVTSWKVRNPHSGEFEDALYVGSEIKRTGIPILFPNYNESGGNVPTHGFGRASSWDVVQTPGSGKVVMRLGSDSISEEAKAVYPYKFETAIEIEAAEDGSLLYTLKVKNLGEETMPIAPGLHPYFPMIQEEKPNIETEGISEFDAASFDWDKNPPDNEYNFSRRAVIKGPQRTIVIEDITPIPVVRKMVVWSQTPQKPDYNFVCFEPVTRGDNALTDNPINVAPTTEWTMNLRFSSVTT